MEAKEIVDVACEALTDKKGMDLVVIDVRTLSTITDFMVLVSGGSAPQLNALSESVERKLKEFGEKVFRTSGTPDSEWIVLDYVNAVIHIFSEEARAFYDLQSLWKDGIILETPELPV